MLLHTIYCVVPNLVFFSVLLSVSVLSPVSCGSFHLPCLLYAQVNSDLVAQHGQIAHVSVCERERQKEREGICFEGHDCMER